MDEAVLNHLFDKFSDIRVAVVGDLFADHWMMIDRDLDEKSLETGLTAYQVVSRKIEPGAVGTILRDLATLGAGQLHLVSLIGDDGDGHELLQMLMQYGVNTERVTQSHQIVTPAYMKPMFYNSTTRPVEHNRLDLKNHTQTPHTLQQMVIENLKAIAPQVDAILVLDQVVNEGTGVVTPAVREALAQLAVDHPELLIFADSRAHIDKFNNVLVKCNDKEALAITGREPQPFDEAVLGHCLDEMEEKTNGDAIISCGAHGVLAKKDGVTKLFPAVQHGEREIDVVGSGDACSSGIVLSLCAGADPYIAAQMCNLVAGVTIRKLGTTGTATRSEVIDLYNEQQALKSEQ